MSEDLEFEALREEFVESLAERRKRLVPLFALLATKSSEQDAEAALIQLREMGHKLGGAAAPYGFAFLGTVAGALDDVITQAEDRLARDRVLEWAELFDEVLSAAILIRKDPVQFREDRRAKDLISFAESLLSEASS